jgi:hypothetical protein
MWLTAILAAVSLLFSILAYVSGQSLSERQIEGTVRALTSLRSEASLLEKKREDIPATLLAAERQHIDEEVSQQSEELATLREDAHG